MTSTAPQASVAELEERILAGDSTITADDLAAAGAGERHRQLIEQAKSRAEIREFEEARQEAIAQLRVDADEVTTDIDNLAELAATAATALSELIAAITEHNDTVEELVRRARALDIPAATGELVPTDSSGIGWRAAAGRNSDLIVDDRVLHTGTPLDVIARAVRDVIARHKIHQRTWREGTEPTVAQQLDGLDRRTVPTATRTIRVVRRWGQHQAGALVTVDIDAAAWAVSHGYGASLIEPVA